eukprot:Skav229591  [mRNA]  locus=scaffold510:164118:165701:+ [translate_table: standard]
MPGKFANLHTALLQHPDHLPAVRFKGATPLPLGLDRVLSIAARQMVAKMQSTVPDGNGRYNSLMVLARDCIKVPRWQIVQANLRATT